jgi:hypothetical protein
MTLRVKLEIVPHGDEDKAYEIGRLDIFNKGHVDSTSDECLYGVIEMTPTSGGLHTDLILHGRRAGAWRLVWKTLSELDIKGPA